ncbi:MAG: YceI family protein [Candidatus Methylacidiphilales bacterium]|nr:YceI family protein [Candidatus Methylacidiphilales bacterium]
MKKITRFSALILLPLLLVSPAVAAPQVFKIDPVHSSVGFKIRHLGISWVTGSFKEFEGQVSFDPEKPEASSVVVTVQAASVDTGSAKRDAHLKKPELFNVEKFPTLSFKSTKVEKTGDNTYKVTGDFTLLGTTKPLTVEFTGTDEVKGMQGETRRGGETTFVIKRSDFGMNYSIGPIGDDVQVSLAFSGIKADAGTTP